MTRAQIEQLNQAVRAFNGAERRLRSRYQRSADSLSLAHLSALYVLTVEQEATVGTLAREADLNPASVTAMVDQMEGRGLVQRRRDAQDRRVCWITLTEAGRARVADGQARWGRLLVEAFADTPDVELEAAIRVMARLAALFDTMEPAQSEPAVDSR